MRRYNLLRYMGLESLIHTLREYLEVKWSLAKYRLSIYIYRFIGWTVILLFVFIFWIVAWGLVNLSLAMYLNDLLKSNFLGYLIVAGINFLIGTLFLILLGSRRFTKLVDRLAQKSFSQKDNYEQ